MLPVVCALADAMGILGGYLVAVHQEMLPAALFPSSIQQNLLPADFLKGMLKTVVFGLIITLVGCHQGLKTEGGRDGGRAGDDQHRRAVHRADLHHELLPGLRHVPQGDVRFEQLTTAGPGRAQARPGPD